MAIVKMSKFNLFSFESQKEALLEKLQSFERVEFISQQLENEELLVKDSQPENVSEIESDLSKVKFVIDLLTKYSPKEGALETLKKGKLSLTYKEIKEKAQKSNWCNLYEEIKENDDLLLKLKNETSKLKSDMETLYPWIGLDVAFSDLKGLSTSVCYIGSIPKSFKETFRENFEREIPYCYIEMVGEEKDEANVLVIVYKEQEEKALELLKSYSFNRASLGFDGIPRSVIKSCAKRIDEIKKEEENVKETIKKYTKYLEEFQIVYEYLNNDYIKAKACENFVRTENIVWIKGWVPTECTSRLETLVKEATKGDYYLEMEEAQKDDESVPVLLKNNKLVEAFEPITEMYSMPKYNEIDPTPLLTPFYLVFFGMMLADVGYGILLFLGSLFALKKFNLGKKQEGFAKFFLYLSIPTTITGWVYGGCFGDAIKIPGLVDPSKDMMKILVASILMGLVHLYFGLGIKAYLLIRDGKPLDALYDVGFWYMALTGSILFLGGGSIGMSASGIAISKYVMIIGMVGLVLTQGRSNKSVGAKLAAGLYGLYGITGYVGDFVSYSRLMALGLAGGFIGGAFNMLIAMIPSPFNIVAGIIIFPLGHIFNMLLSMLGAYVHTCRLQYVEYFGKFYEGGGKSFSPFKAKNNYIEVKRD